MKTKLILKSLSDLPSPTPETGASPGCAPSMPDHHVHSPAPSTPLRGRWDSKPSSGETLVTMLDRMAPAHLHAN